MSVLVWILRAGPDVVLNQRSQSRLGQILVAVDAGIDQKVYVVRSRPARCKQTLADPTARCSALCRERQPARATSRCSITVPIAAHQILVQGEENDADLQT